MAINCEKAKWLLDSYHDRQLRGRKFDAMSEHLRECENCTGELEKLQRISRALKERYESVALGEKGFSRVWAGVDAAIGDREAPPAESLLDRLAAILWIPRPAWAAVAAVAVLIVMVFAYMPGDRQTPVMAANDCIIDSVDAQDCSVMVREVGDSKMKIIWILDQQPVSPEEET